MTKQTSTFSSCVVALAALLSVACAQGTIYAVRNGENDKTFFTLNTSASMPVLTPYVDMLEPGMNVPPECIGHQNEQPPSPLNPFSPNGLGYDGATRLYFVAFDLNGRPDREARLCLLNVFRPLFFYVGNLPTTGVTSGAFDQAQYVFIYLENGDATLQLDLVVLNRATGGIETRLSVTQFVDRTNDPNNQDASPIELVFRGGDLVSDCNSIIYASSVGTNGAQSRYFRIQQLEFLARYSFELLAGGVNNDQPQEFAVNSQMAFADSGDLVVHNTPTGRTSNVLNLTTGETGYLGMEGVDYVIFRDSQSEPIGFSDLASFLNCDGIDLCLPAITPNQCAPGEFFTVYEPTSDPDGVQCVRVDDYCLQPPECLERFQCQYYIPV